MSSFYNVLQFHSDPVFYCLLEKLKQGGNVRHTTFYIVVKIPHDYFHNVYVYKWSIIRKLVFIFVDQFIAVLTYWNNHFICAL